MKSMTSVTLWMFSVLLSFVLTESHAQKVTPGSRYQAALCIVKWKKCTKRNARLSEVCKLNRRPWQQPLICRQRACDFCKYFGPPDTIPCMSPRLKYVCENLIPKPSTPSSPTPTPTTTTTPSPVAAQYLSQGNDKPKQMPMPVPQQQTYHSKDMDRCTWTALGDSIVIDLGAITPPDGWTPITRGKYRGIVYEKEKGGGIDPAGKYGKVCFNIKPMYSGSYFFTAISNAEHWTEHNDCWVMSSKGFRHYKPNNAKQMFVSDPMEWIKGYQNNGPSGMSGSLSTKDHDSHTFVIPNVVAGETFQVCIAGRSYRYEMFRLVLVHCGENEMCKHGDVMDMPVSPCMM